MGGDHVTRGAGRVSVNREGVLRIVTVSQGIFAISNYFIMLFSKKLPLQRKKKTIYILGSLEAGSLSHKPEAWLRSRSAHLMGCCGLHSPRRWATHTKKRTLGYSICIWGTDIQRERAPSAAFSLWSDIAEASSVHFLEVIQPH